MKRIFTLLLLCMPAAIMAQQYNNEWINFNQTYYKFKVGATGIYRIPQSVLSTAGLGGTPAQQFQLWKNGQQVPIYSTVATGTMGASDYLEFWAEANDGKADKPLYRDPGFQHTDKISLQTDTAVYFLTASAAGGLRYAQVTNNVAGNLLPAEPWFLHTEGSYFRAKANPGFAAVVGEYVYSSSYDKGEFYSSRDITPTSPVNDVKNNLFVNTSGPDAILKYGAFGNALNNRSVRVSVNGTPLADTVMDFFNEIQTTISFPTSVIASGTATTTFANTSPATTDRMVISFFELIYPRQFNFGGSRNFYFELPAKAAGYYLEISNFSVGSVTPVLYDLVSHERYAGETSAPGLVRFALPGSASDRKMVLVSEEAININTVTTLATRTFTNYANTANQGTYLIISNPLLFNGTTGNNPVQDYAAYRQTSNGGGYVSKVYDINELVDQFAFGIKKHPLSVKNFLRYARATFSVQPEFVFLMGRGMTYTEYRRFESNPDADRLNLIPTFGAPASDNNLSAENSMPGIALTPIGRLSV
ncbi:MAG: hypothetical protein WCF67_08480, partial [Chitinophagaceae bacterium]